MHSNAQINLKMTEFVEILQDYNRKTEWDPNFAEGYKVMDIGDNVQLHYLRTKKVAVVSSRDQYMLICNRYIEPENSPNGKRTLIIGTRSLDHDKFPPKPGYVRAFTFMSGYYIEEIEPGKLDVHFLLESDFKISLFVQKQVAPKNTNFPYFLQQWALKKR